MSDEQVKDALENAETALSTETEASEIAAEATASVETAETSFAESSEEELAALDVEGDGSEAESEKAEAGEEDDDVDPVSLKKVQDILNASLDQQNLNPQMRRMMQRQVETTKRVEASIKGTKSNPAWFVPLFCALMVLGLVWTVVYYLQGTYPIPGIGDWNIAIGFAILLAGFLMTMWWR